MIVFRIYVQENTSIVTVKRIICIAFVVINFQPCIKLDFCSIQKS